MNVDNKYVPKKEYRVFIGSDSGGDIHIFQYTGKSFETHDYAEQWITDEGERNIHYIIIETFTKP